MCLPLTLSSPLFFLLPILISPPSHSSPSISFSFSFLPSPSLPLSPPLSPSPRGRQWISQFPVVFEADPQLEETMGDLWALVRADGDQTHSQLTDPSCL